VSFYDDHRKYHIKTLGTNRREAELYEQKIKTLKAENRLNEVLEKNKKTPVILVKEYAKEYIEWYKSKNKGWKLTRASQIKKFTKKFKSELLSNIKQLDIENYITERQKEISPYSKKIIKKGTVDADIVAIKHFFNKAIEWEYLKENPTKNIKKFNESNIRVRFLEYEEVERLVSNCDPYLKSIVQCAVLTGMRKSEILNLNWFQVDLKKRLITLPEQKNKEIGYVYISDELLNLLEKLKKERKSEYVFTNENGGKISSFKRSFKTALKRSNIANFRFHDLRHTFASLLVKNGVHPMIVQRLMRHKSLDMTMRYSHLSDKDIWNAADDLGQKVSRGKLNNNNLIIIEDYKNAKNL
tara:strand:- start:908 stop:1972 length:1065 start_codon:yes stop_codon:yes gene_type:complete